MSMFKRRHHDMPGLNMASMPDLIFTVLFFFMIVTHMRSVPLKVAYQVPAGTELTKLTRKSAVTHIYIGKPVTALLQKANAGDTTCIQLNDKYARMEEIGEFVSQERREMLPEDVQQMTVSIKADRNTDMGTITDVKQMLRRAKAYTVNYSAVNR